MEINIESLNVSIETGEADGGEIAREVQQCICLAVERLLQEELIILDHSESPVVLDLQINDWEAEQDKPGKIVQLIRDAL